MNQLTELIKNAKHIIAFTGDGISTESGKVVYA
jgi:NAD-dependent SIR2 family protein deacetylase